MSCLNLVDPPFVPAREADATLDLSFVDRTVAELGRGPEMVIAILQAIQEHYRYLPDAAMKRVCEITEITPAAIAGVSTFYGQFRHTPVGKHLIRVCHGTACHVKGAGLIEDTLRRELKIEGSGDTDASKTFTLQSVACLGCCTLAPVVQIDDVTYGYLTPSTVAPMLRDFLEAKSKCSSTQSSKKSIPAPLSSGSSEIRVGLGSCCVAKGSGDVQEALSNAVARASVDVAIKRVGCVGICHQTPMVEVIQPGKPPALYAKVSAEDAADIVARHFPSQSRLRRMKNVCAELLDSILHGPPEEAVTRYAIDVRDPPVHAFLGRQIHIATEHCGNIDPLDIDEYRRNDGFKALSRCLDELKPEAIIEQIRASGLRGRGGAGFLSGTKWAAVRAAKGELKYVICNGDEGDPGAFMDRMILESFPYRVIEGMAIAAIATGASEGIFYIRAEYPLACRRINEALKRCMERGILGERIMGRAGFKLSMRIVQGAGAFVCGEETALMASVEGRRGMPRLRPPFPAESGLWGKPTLINNVETLATVPWIIRNGAERFATLGTPDSRGTKVFALAGKVARGGLIEVPMGITLRQIVEEIGGGIAGGKRFKAVQVGGPSGGCVPAALADTKVDYQALTAVGAIMGSGGMVVMDESDCMVDIARYFLQFTQTESCGRCTFCRIGTRRMRDILERLCAGQGKKGDLEELEHLAQVVNRGSLCGLGKTAPNPVLTTLKYFRDEYEAHLQKRCPAGKCKALIGYYVTDGCIGCTICSQQCPVDAIPMKPYLKHEIDLKKCTRCDTCRQVCPTQAIKVE
jgi:NADH:ubiquinone oxidoreductase subunit F (NADH-binding)/NADH:ubiquinone oxidoreductase subunit E/Pyruvate/2-oxoacid:ferredoxin oxidoreductase delta subunit